MIFLISVGGYKFMAAGRPRKFDYDKALDHAMRVFWEKGYDGTSMSDLTAAMCMNRPSIYAAYGNKEELFCKAMDRYAAQASVFINAQLDKPTLKESLSALLCGVVQAYSGRDNPKGCMAVQGALACSDEAQGVRKHATQGREKMVKILELRFVRAVQDNELPKDSDITGLARFFVAIMQGLSVQSAGGVSDETMREIAHRALMVLPSR
jgi:AcrR family transcriptional regulator